jgi:hypothetical protein
MKGTETGTHAAMLGLPRPPRQTAFAAVPLARRGYDRVAAIAGERTRLRSNNTMQRRPRSTVLISTGEAARGPADGGR